MACLSMVNRVEVRIVNHYVIPMHQVAVFVRVT